MSEKLYDVMAATGSYMKDGQERKRWTKCGVVLKSDNGNVSIKMDAIPVGEWNGWFSLFKDDRNQQPAAQPPAAKADINDDIPF